MESLSISLTRTEILTWNILIGWIRDDSVFLKQTIVNSVSLQGAEGIRSQTVIGPNGTRVATRLGEREYSSEGYMCNLIVGG